MSERPQIVSHENALKWIAHIAGIHYAGRAFDPQHMKSLQWLAAEALAGKPMVDFARIEAQNPGIDLEEVRRQWKDAAHPGIDMAEVQRQRQHRRMVEDLARRGRDAFMASEQPAPLFFGDVPVVDDDEDAGPQERPKP